MSRPLRIEYSGALYHITARGNERNPIYREDRDYQRFLEILSELPQRYGIIIHGYVLMANHYHLLIETPKGNIRKVMHYLNAVYTGYFNRRYKRVGHLFQGRYKAFLIDKERYLVSVSRYIHLNPVRAGMVSKPERYKWSSYLDYIRKRQKNGWLTRDWILRKYSRDKTEAGKLYQAFIEEGLSLKENPFDSLKAGIILGSESFINEIKKKVGLRGHREIPESRILTRGIRFEDVIGLVVKKFRIREEEIRERGRRGNLARKICLYLLRRYTDIDNEEIAGYFGVGYTAVSQAALRIKREMTENRRINRIVGELETKLQVIK
jgi:putative transposase